MLAGNLRVGVRYNGNNDEWLSSAGTQATGSLGRKALSKIQKGGRVSWDVGRCVVTGACRLVTTWGVKFPVITNRRNESTKGNRTSEKGEVS